MKKILIGAGIVAVALGGAYAVYRFTQKPGDPAQQRQAPAPAPVVVNPQPFQFQPNSYAQGASPLIPQVQSGLTGVAQVSGIVANAASVANSLGLFDGSDDE